MFQNSEIALRLGKLHNPEGLLIPPQDINKLPRNQVALVLTGSQGEPMEAHSRVAVNNHRCVTIEPGDEVVISARVIPGNEKPIFRMIDHLYRRGARVCYNDGSQPLVHVSGHGDADSQMITLNLRRHFELRIGAWTGKPSSKRRRSSDSQ